MPTRRVGTGPTTLPHMYYTSLLASIHALAIARARAEPRGPDATTVGAPPDWRGIAPRGGAERMCNDSSRARSVSALPRAPLRKGAAPARLALGRARIHCASRTACSAAPLSGRGTLARLSPAAASASFQGS